MKRFDYNKANSIVAITTIAMLIVLIPALVKNMTDTEALPLIIVAFAIFFIGCGIAVYVESKDKNRYDMEIQDETLYIYGDYFQYSFPKEHVEIYPQKDNKKVTVEWPDIIEVTLDCNKRAIRFLERFKNS